jgi:pilus assembly protein CpaC
MKIKSLHIPISVFILSFAMWGSAFAQNNPASDEPGSKYLILYQGVEHEETLSMLPPGAEFGGDWRGVTKILVAKEYQKIQFTPIKAGVATLSIHEKTGNKIFEYRIEVRDTKLTKMVREIRALLSDIEGISIKIVNDRVVVDGKVVHPEDLNRIVGVLGQYGTDAASLVEVSPFAQQKIAEIIEREINNPDVQVRARNGVFVLTGEVQTEFDSKQAELVARTFAPPPFFGDAEKTKDILKPKRDNVANLLHIRPPVQQGEPPPKLIQIVMHFVELTKDYSNSSRFQWTPGLSDQTNVSLVRDTRAPSGVVSTISATISNLLPKLNWAKAHGHARILKTTSVITKDGVQGEIRQETQMNIIVQNSLGTPTTGQTSFGTTARITPKVVSSKSDAINLQVAIEVSDVIGFTSNGPSIAKNMINTQVDVRSGESAAIGGFIASNQTMDYNKLPANVDNPLFSLYSSKAFQKGQSQFVVFITPVIKSSASSGVEKVKEKFRLNE